MRCLMCGKNRDAGSLKDILYGNDPLCSECRAEWQKKRIRFRIEGIPAESSYVYNRAFSRCLIQYKECGDEALKDVFLYEVREYLQLRYHGYVLCLMPSSEEKREVRGFSHLSLMFSCLNMKMLEPFAKQSSQSQKVLHRRERMEMSHLITLKENIELPDKILLCDDTVTTGATLSGALSCLAQRVKKVRIYTVSANAAWL